MKILILSNLYPPDILGGYELLARDIAEELARCGHTVRVLTTGGPGGPGNVTRSLRLARPFGRPAGRDRLRHLWAGLVNRAAMWRYLRTQGRPDVVLVMSLRRLGLAPLRVLQEAGVPFVLTVHDDWPVAFGVGQAAGLHTRMGHWLDEVLIPTRSWCGITPASVVYLSRAVRGSVRAAGVPLPPGEVRPQGVDLSLFTPRPFRPMRPEPRLLFVGRLHPSKAPEVALEALSELERRGVTASLTFAGEADAPEYREALQRRARALGLEERVTWAGQVPRERLPLLYWEADALLFLSRLAHEGQGLTYLEAMACGVPVVASPSGGAREFLERHAAARLAPACRSGFLADELASLHRAPEAQEALVTRALGIVRAHASLETYVQGLEDVLRQAARRQAPEPSRNETHEAHTP
ncbi:glycosyltransferase family 4 protein [Archangium gephyra]|uniref:glycosyltransferase family 4 protein n=1 Tax=Archangium gephyra TaxID=48 RepID=UPI0035D4DCD8